MDHADGLAPANVEKVIAMDEQWQPISTAPEGIVVMTKLDDEHGIRNEQTMRRSGRLWWFPDGSMYAYYTPTHWRPAQR